VWNLYLKRIEMQGFKSFADKTKIEFKDNITAIVGPNGSGKSNISDAISWVLGEQSVKSLRGSKMEDIIFSGTDKRRALGFTEVTIIFDNQDRYIPVEYGEVAIRRRMFRSGESEYYINKNQCRLKDIRQLIVDAGIGKEGYSIIGQGRIDEILSDRPEDRRHVFEVASGVVKYKLRKEEAEKKLKTTENNLVRIKDLIWEITEQFKKLEIESKKANRFVDLYDELKELDINITIINIKNIGKDISKLNQDIDNINKEIGEREIIRQEAEDEFHVLRNETNKAEEKMEDLRNKKIELIKLQEKYKNDMSIAKEKEIY